MANIDERLSPVAREAILKSREVFVDMQINPLLSSLPPKFLDRGFYPHQIPAVQGIVRAFQSVPVVVLEAPTGSGKTVIAEVVRRMLHARAVYICSSKSLQDQFLADFDYARVVKGRSNYPTEIFPERFDPSSWETHLSADDCTANESNGYNCKWCSAKFRCPYEVAKREAIRSELAVLNTSYFLGECNNVGRFKGRDLVIADEADTLESSLMGYVSVEISERRMAKYGWTPPKKLTVVASWIEWLDDVIPQIANMFDNLPPEGMNVRDDRERKFLVGLWEKLYRVREDLNTEDHAWVYTGKGHDGGGRSAKNVGLEVSFKPSRVDKFGEKMLWRHGNKWLLMSATIISADEMMESLGYNGPFEVVRAPNVFPVKNRLVKYVGAVDMAAKNKVNAWPEVAKSVVSIAASHPKDRVLVHSVSYELTTHLVNALKSSGRPVVSYKTAAMRESALARFKRTRGAILVAPSMDRGIDLPGDLCRVQVLVKCPFPYIGDRQVAARMYSRGGDLWYAVQTIRVIVQMCGRAVRSVDDWAVTYVLDRQFKENLWARYRSLFPQWFVDSIVWNGKIEGTEEHGRTS